MGEVTNQDSSEDTYDNLVKYFGGLEDEDNEDEEKGIVRWYQNVIYIDTHSGLSESSSMCTNISCNASSFKSGGSLSSLCSCITSKSSRETDMETEVRKLDGDTLVKLGKIADNAKDVLGVVESNEKMMILVPGRAFYEKMELARMAGGDVTNDEVLRWNPMTGSHFNNEGEQVIHNEDVNTVNDITFINEWGVRLHLDICIQYLNI